MIELDHISKSYGQKKVLDNVTLSIDSGSFTCIFGPGGAGKTTLMKIISGVETSDSGKIICDGEDITNKPPRERKIGMVFQNFALYPHFNVYQNIASPLVAQKVPKGKLDERVKKTANFLGMERFLSRSVDRLSGGERQRVAIGRALVKEPDILLLDEIMANVDAKIRTSMRAQLKTIQKTLGKYVIYSTPDPVEVFALADKVCVMNQGQVFQFDTPDEVYKHPVNLTTAVRFGSPAMNTYSCHLVEKGNELTLEAKDFKLDVRPLRETLKKSPSKDLVIGLRPEDLRIADGKEKPDFVLPAKIFGYEITGSDTVVYVRVGEALMSVFVPSIYEPVLDSDVRICFDMDALYFFQETGEPVR